MDLSKFLESLTDEQKEALRQVLGSSEQTTKSTKKTSKLGDAPVARRKRTPTSKTTNKRTGKRKESTDSRIPKAKVLAPPVNVNLGKRKNIFSDSEAFLGEATYSKLQEDREIDKKLWGKNKASSRHNRQTVVESTCTRCGVVEEVSQRLLTKDEDKPGQIIHICDSCQRK